jgi:hypothetical protein
MHNAIRINEAQKCLRMVQNTVLKLGRRSQAQQEATSQHDTHRVTTIVPSVLNISNSGPRQLMGTRAQSQAQPRAAQALTCRVHGAKSLGVCATHCCNAPACLANMRITLKISQGNWCMADVHAGDLVPAAIKGKHNKPDDAGDSCQHSLQHKEHFSLAAGVQQYCSSGRLLHSIRASAQQHTDGQQCKIHGARTALLVWPIQGARPCSYAQLSALKAWNQPLSAPHAWDQATSTHGRPPLL